MSDCGQLFSSVCISSISFPLDWEPGPIFCIIQDASGNLYCSDELNHAVLSIDPRGQILWMCNSKGTTNGCLQYPKGMSLGFLHRQNSLVQCLAVCDSWNHRIQFFSLTGEWIDCWDGAGKSKFGVVTDIRFILPDGHSDPSNGYWLILDRDHHRLYSMDLFGRVLDKFGKCYPGWKTSHWAAKLLASEPEQPWEQPHYDRLFDPLYYPFRIMGNSEKALYVSETFSGNLKQLVHGNIFVVLPKDFSDFDWLAAGESALVCLDPKSRKLHLVRPDGVYESPNPFNGTPIPSNLEFNELWFQNDTHLQCLRFPNFLHKPQGNSEKPFALVQGFLCSFLDNFFLESSCNSQLSQYLHCIDQILDLTQSALLNSQQSSGFKDQFNSLHRQLLELCKKISAIGLALRESVLYTSEMLLACRSLFHFAVAKSDSELSTDDFFGNLHRLFMLPLDNAFVAMNHASDDIHIRAADLHSSTEDSCSFALFGLVNQFSSVMQDISYLLTLLNSIFPYPNRQIPELQHKGPKRIYPSFYRSKQPTNLHEIDRIALTQEAGREPVCPFDLAQAPDGQIYISLSGADCIARLSASGQFLSYLPQSIGAAPPPFKPAGISIDICGRLLVAEFLKHRIWMYDPPLQKTSYFPGSEESQISLRHPHGIRSLSENSMVIADTGNSRLVIIRGSEIIVLGKFGIEECQFRHPISVILNPRQGDDDSYWIVDQRNHRVQHLAATGEFLCSIGKPGIGNGCLVLPESAAFLQDGSLIVAQCRFHNELKCFSSNGQELWAMPLNYSPGGMLVSNNILFVTEASGNHLRVYNIR